MAYPTAESNNKEGGSPNKAESEAVGNYAQDSVDKVQADSEDTDGQYDQVTVGPYVDRKHPHQDADDRKPGDHPHKDLARNAK